MIFCCILVTLVMGIISFLDFKKFKELKICLQTSTLLSLILHKYSVNWFYIVLFEILILSFICYILSKLNSNKETDESLKLKLKLEKMETQLMIEELQRQEVQKELQELRVIVSSGYASLAHELSKAIKDSKEKTTPDLDTINILTKIYTKVRKCYTPKPLIVIPKDSFKYKFDLWLAKKDLLYIKKHMKYGSTFESYIDACLEDINRKEKKL